MTSKIIVLCALVAAVTGGFIDAPGHLAYSGQSQLAYSSAPSVSTVYSSVAAPAKTYSIAAPIAAKTYSYVAPVATSAIHAAPLVQAVHTAPVVKYSPSTAVSSSYLSFGTPAKLSYADSVPTLKTVGLTAPVVKTLTTYAAPVTSVAKTVSYAPTHVAYHTPAIGSSHQNVIRSFDGTVSQYSKAVDTAFSSVRKYDTRINNNVYAPAIAKTVIAGHVAPEIYSHAAPAIYANHAAPAVYAAHTSPVYSAAAPAIYANHAARAVYAAPAVYAAHTSPVYSAAAPAYTTKAFSYASAVPVAHHVSFEGYGTKYGW